MSTKIKPAPGFEHPFDMDEDGDISAYPLAGWTGMTLMQTTILLQLQYLQDQTDSSAQCRHLQIVFGPNEGLDLAGKLTEWARLILDAPRPPGRAH